MTAEADQEALESLSDDDLTSRAASGDNDAATTFLLRHHSFLLAMAHRICNGAISADDLLAEALAGLVARWRETGTPATSVLAYLIRSMRNRIIDEYRSPRSRVTPLHPTEDLPDDTHSGMHLAELDREFTLVRKALNRLPADQRSALLAVVVEGRKARDLEEELGRPASAIHSLTRRSTLALRRATLIEMLEEDAPEECRRQARWLPRQVPDNPDDAADSRGMDHIRDCARCRGVWATFTRISTTLGVTSLLVLVGLRDGGLPGAAAATGPDRVPQDQDEHSGEEAPTSPSSEPEDDEDPSPTSGAKTRDNRSRRALRWSLAGLAMTVAVVLLAIEMSSPAGEIASPLASPQAHLTAISQARSGGFVIAVDFRVESHDWTVTELQLRTPQDDLISVPEGWSCQQSADLTRCTSEVLNAAGGEFSYSSSELTGTFEAGLTAVADGETLQIDAIGPVEASAAPSQDESPR